ncbi:MAG: type II toxin-antitoxin system Phd/YefM family antitoxin [Salinibacter sp.]
MEPDTTEADVQDLTDHLSAYLQRVEAGETVTITREGEPIGRFVPAQEEQDKDQTKDRSREEKLQVLQEAGLAEWSGKKFSPSEPVAKVKGDRMVSELLLEDRR